MAKKNKKKEDENNKKQIKKVNKKTNRKNSNLSNKSNNSKNNSKNNNNNNKNKNKNKITFNEEQNFNQGDKSSNPNENEKNDNNDNDNGNKKSKTIKKNKNMDITNNNSKDYPHDYYNLGEHYIYESQKPRIVGYSFGKTSGVKPREIKGKKGKDSFFYNIREKYINESQKPYAPKYSFGRPKSFIPSQKKNNKKYKLRPQSAIFNHNLKNQIEEEKNNNFKIYMTNGPGPAFYDTRGNFGENALKISISPCGRKNQNDNGVPGPNSYYPDYTVVKKQYPIYSIGNAERDGCYEGYYPINHSSNVSYGTQYYRRNPSWIISKKSKGEYFNRLINENCRYNN